MGKDLGIRRLLAGRDDTSVVVLRPLELPSQLFAWKRSLSECRHHHSRCIPLFLLPPNVSPPFLMRWSLLPIFTFQPGFRTPIVSSYLTSTSTSPHLLSPSHPAIKYHSPSVPSVVKSTKTSVTHPSPSLSLVLSLSPHVLQSRVRIGLESPAELEEVVPGLLTRARAGLEGRIGRPDWKEKQGQGRRREAKPGRRTVEQVDEQFRHLRDA